MSSAWHPHCGYGCGFCTPHTNWEDLKRELDIEPEWEFPHDERDSFGWQEFLFFVLLGAGWLLMLAAWLFMMTTVLFVR